MKGPKMLTGSICDHGRRHHKRVSSAKGKRVLAKPGHSDGDTKKTQDNVASLNNVTVETEDVKELDCVDEDKCVTHVADILPDKDDVVPGSETEDKDSIKSDSITAPTDTDILSEKRHIVVDMNIRDDGAELEDDVFENDIKKIQEENAFKTLKPLSRDSQKEKDLNPIDEGDESSVLTIGNDPEIKHETIDQTLPAPPPTNQKLETKSAVNADKVKRHIIKRPKSEKFKRPKSSTVSDDKSKRRPLSCVMSGRPSSGGTTRATIVPNLRVTKAELEYYLPKRSFFSCHDKALKDAGYGPAKTPRQTRMIEAWAKQTECKTNGDRVPTPQDTENTLDRDNQLTAVGDLVDKGDDAFQRHPSESLSEVGNKESVHSVVSQLHDQKLSRQVSNISIRSNAPLTRKLSKLSRRRGDYDEDEIRVDFQPLFLYLKYINENQDEYLHQHKQYKYGIPSQDSIVKMGNIYRRGRHGSSSDSLLVNAVHDIKPRFSDPGQWTNTNKEKTLLNLTSSKKEPGPVLSKHESHDPGADEPKTEFEKIKHKMEAWLKTVTTAQLVKAKELALRELGEEDVSQSRWWVSLRSCHYLR
ncbi:uncharacterized protein LOC117323926 [Pecten maximus]|uniref:uncharacterized protein LOC117323926 n=1 Tax=Pecten maximus TaxID=6579 RepID=UPI001458A397|nr:uncharacterized protein LOC117323926 [Pecten maximus]XP_033735351.1 uncharacterized protein LOC117323926 [Pecten maximus]